MNNLNLLPNINFISRLAKSGPFYFFSVPIEYIQANILQFKAKYKIEIYEIDNNRSLLLTLKRKISKNGKQARFTIPLDIMSKNIIDIKKFYEVKVIEFS